MNNIMNFLGVAAWISESFPVIRIVLLILTVLCCAVVIVLALVSPVGTEDGNVITGGETADTFYSQNKSKMNEGLVKKLMSYGLDGIEVYYPYPRFRKIVKFHSSKDVRKIADKYPQLIKTGGTDFHGENFS